MKYTLLQKSLEWLHDNKTGDNQQLYDDTFLKSIKECQQYAKSPAKPGEEGGQKHKEAIEGLYQCMLNQRPDKIPGYLPSNKEFKRISNPSQPVNKIPLAQRRRDSNLSTSSTDSSGTLSNFSDIRSDSPEDIASSP